MLTFYVFIFILSLSLLAFIRSAFLRLHFMIGFLYYYFVIVFVIITVPDHGGGRRK
jgi:hypothetical protein